MIFLVTFSDIPVSKRADLELLPFSSFFSAVSYSVCRVLRSNLALKRCQRECSLTFSLVIRSACFAWSNAEAVSIGKVPPVIVLKRPSVAHIAPRPPPLFLRISQPYYYYSEVTLFPSFFSYALSSKFLF